MDLARRDFQLNGGEVYLAIDWALGIGEDDTKMFVFFCRPGDQVGAVLEAINGHSDMYKKVEIGSFKKKESIIYDDNLFPSRDETIILAGMSVDDLSNESWKKVFFPMGKKYPTNYFFSLPKDMDFGKFRSTKDPGEKTDEEEIRLQNLTDLAPRWDMLEMGQGLVNLDCKPSRVIEHFIKYYSMTADTILDFFSGGQVLKTALFCGRECFSIAKSKREVEFLTDYPYYLRQSQMVQKTWDNVKIMHDGGEIEHENSDDEEQQDQDASLDQNVQPLAQGKAFVLQDDKFFDDILAEQSLTVVNPENPVNPDVPLNPLLLNEVPSDQVLLNPVPPNQVSSDQVPPNEVPVGQETIDKADQSGKEIILYSPDVFGSKIQPHTFQNIEIVIGQFLEQHKDDDNLLLGHMNRQKIKTGYKIIEGPYKGTTIPENRMMDFRKEHGEKYRYERVYETVAVAGDASSSLQQSLGSNSIIYEYGSLLVGDQEEDSSESKGT